MGTQRYQVGRYVVHEPMPGRFHVYQDSQRTGIDFVSLERAVMWITQMQQKEILDMARGSGSL